METVQDKRVAALSFLQDRGEPVQCWSSAENFRGFLDIFTRCVRRTRHPDGLYDLTNFGRHAPFRLGLLANDGVTILRASGVGGGHWSTRTRRSDRRTSCSTTRAGR